MFLYVVYAMLLGALVIAVIVAVPGLSERMRRWLVAAVALLVLVPGLIFLILS